MKALKNALDKHTSLSSKAKKEIIRRWNIVDELEIMLLDHKIKELEFRLMVINWFLENPDAKVVDFRLFNKQPQVFWFDVLRKLVGILPYPDERNVKIKG